MSKAEQRSRTTARTHAGRAGVGLALAATTAVGVSVPATQAAAVPAQPHTAVHGSTVGATALAFQRPVTAAPVMTYRVQAGDTVTHIAKRTGSSVSAIVAANSLDSRALIRVGQMLKVPSAAAASTAAPASAPAAKATPKTHTVRAGDTVSALAKTYGTTVSAIISANKLSSTGLIRVGQELAVGAMVAIASTSTQTGAPAAPAPTASATTHTVGPGDTVSVLAKKYGTTVSAIVSANNLRSAGLIYVGQRLTVRGTSAAAAPTTTTPATSAPVASGSHTVRPGETVSGLAKSWGTTVAAIVQANKLSTSGLIYVGQKLTVPGAAAPSAPSTTGQLVPNSFLGRTYPAATVASANANKATLLSVGVPARAEMQALVVQVARQMGVDPALAQAHAYQESGFNHASVSPANAIGTMQVIPTSGDWASQMVGRKLNLLDPYDNVVAGVAIIRQLQRTSPSLEAGIAGYYQGAGSVKRNGFFADTTSYVAAVKAHMKRF